MNTREHIDLIVSKYLRLGEAMEDAFAQHLLEIQRADLTPTQQLAAYEWARALPFPGSASRMSKALGVSMTVLNIWRKSGAPDDNREFRGTFPLNYQLTPTKGRPCVYLLFVGFTVVYVGMSQNVRQRLKTHWTEGVKGKLTGWEVIPCDSQEQAAALEGDLIYQHKPIYNQKDRLTRRWVR